MKTKVELEELIAYAFEETGLAKLGQEDNDIADKLQMAMQLITSNIFPRGKQVITLSLPIKIKPTTTDKGIIITDDDNVRHYFYDEEVIMKYDGNTYPVK